MNSTSLDHAVGLRGKGLESTTQVVANTSTLTRISTECLSVRLSPQTQTLQFLVTAPHISRRDRLWLEGEGLPLRCECCFPGKQGEEGIFLRFLSVSEITKWQVSTMCLTQGRELSGWGKALLIG